MRYAFLVPLLLITAATRGQDSPADRIAGLLTDDAIAVGRVDLASLNAEAAFDRLSPFLAAGGAAPESLRQPAADAIAALRKAGVREVFVVLSPTDLPDGRPYLLIPARGVDEAAVVGLVTAMTGNQPDEITTKLGDAIYSGPKTTSDRLKAPSVTAARAGLAEAFAAVEGSPVQVMLTPSAEHRRVLREMLPDLPRDFGGATGEQLAAGLRWAAVGVGFEPKLTGKVVVQGESDQAAEALKTALVASLRRLSTAPDVLKTFPMMPLFVGALTPAREGDRLVLVGDAALDAAAKLLGGAVGTARGAAAQSQSVNNLKQIALAFHNFHDAYGSFPPHAGYDGDKPLLSWRVYLLPYLEEGALYNEFHLDEPWDSEHNKKLLDRMPAVFESPTLRTPAGHTAFLAPTGPGLLFGDKAGIPLQEIKDGLSNTVLVVEATADKAVPWTKPEDLTIDPASPLQGLTEGREKFPAALCDGAVRQFPATIAAETFLKLLTPSGGEVINEPF